MTADAIQGRQIVLRWDRDRDPLELRRREWLVTNGLGGYSSGTIAGIPTRKYHGLFVPNLAAPKGRHIMISRCDESVVTSTRRLHLGGAEFENERFENRLFTRDLVRETELPSSDMAPRNLPSGLRPRLLR